MLPSLPPLNNQLRQLMRGPTVYSNWVVPGVVMVGAYPGMLDDKQNDCNLKLFLKLRLDTFVCLQSELNIDIPEEIWRTGQGLRPYIHDFKRICKKSIKWHHCPIVDCNVTEDEVVETLVEALLEDVRAGRKLYVHCWGGHGRAGIIVCLLLARLYGLPAKEAFKRVQKYHDCRVEPQQCRSPQTIVQRDQVRRLLQKWAESGVYAPAEEVQCTEKAGSSRSRAVFPTSGRAVSSRSSSRGSIRGSSFCSSTSSTSNISSVLVATGKNACGNSMAKGSNVRAQIASIYGTHCPTKVPDIDAVMKRFKGREKELLSKVRLKYTSRSLQASRS
jgi:hypothetical protein